jgi:ubiquitin C-terminal hydrolase
MKKSFDTKHPLVREYINLVKIMWLTKTKKFCHNPKSFYEEFKKTFQNFDNKDEHDCHEVVVCLLDVLDTELKIDLGRGPTSLVREIFYGEMVQEVVYPGGKTRTFEDSTNLMFFLSRPSTLEECFVEYTKWNTISGYEDTQGKVHNVSTSRHLFWKTPYILIVCFKVYGGKFPVTLPETLDLTRWIHPESPHTNKKTYEFYATCAHQGNTHGGHYVAGVKHKGQWYAKDDALVKEMTEAPLQADHYLVFFKAV